MSNIRENAIPLEVKKDGLSQLQDGSWVLKLKVHPNDMRVPLMQAPMGTRYQVALVELNDDETVKEQPKRDHKLAFQASVLCTEPLFRQFLWRKHFTDWDTAPGEEEAPGCVRQICNVGSRADFDTDPEAGTRWRSLKADYEMWKAV